MSQLSPADPIVILSYARTPMGAMQGALAEMPATALGAVAVKAAVERAGVAGEDIDRAYIGCVLPAGLGQAPARQAAILAGLPLSVEATTVNKVCGSGMQTVIMGSEALASGTIDMVVAGGMESMTNAPYLLKKHRSGARLGHDTAYDHMFLDGLEDAYEPGRAMGTFAQDTANAYQMTREEMDDYAIESLARANRAIESGAFASEVVPVTVTTRTGDVVVEHDEETIRGADHIVDLGPRAGVLGGDLIFEGDLQKIISHKDSLTGQYLSGKKKIAVPKQRRKGNGQHLVLKGATGNNLKNVDLKIPLGTFVCVTGVSGSGKSTLIVDTLYPLLARSLHNSQMKPAPHKSL
jgi:hypothetical protein